MNKEKNKVIVIGAGISGLCSAFWLKSGGADVTLLEKNNFAGGNIRTEVSEGYMVEHGPNSTLETTPLINELLEQLGIPDEKVYAGDSAKKRYVLRDGKLYPIPLGPAEFLGTKLFSPGAKLRLLKEPFISSRSDEKESIADFTRRRLGQEFLDYAINPFVAGVFAGDPADLNVKTAFPKLYELEQNYGSLIGGAIRSRRKRKKSKEVSKQSAKTISFRKGMQALTDSIYESLKGNVKLGADVLKLEIENNDAGGKRYFVEYKLGGTTHKECADAVVISAPAGFASRLIGGLDGGLSGRLSGIYYPPVTVVFAGFSKKHVGIKLDGFGYLIPEKEKRNILGSLWNSVLFEGRAPEGSHAVTSFVGGSRQPELAVKPDDEVLDMTLKELASIMDISGKPEYVRIIRWNRAIPQYNNNYARLTGDIEMFHRNNTSVRLCSNFFGGISVSDCIKNAHSAAQDILHYLNQLDN